MYTYSINNRLNATPTDPIWAAIPHDLLPDVGAGAGVAAVPVLLHHQPAHGRLLRGARPRHRLRFQCHCKFLETVFDETFTVRFVAQERSFYHLTTCSL